MGNVYIRFWNENAMFKGHLGFQLITIKLKSIMEGWDSNECARVYK